MSWINDPLILFQYNLDSEDRRRLEIIQLILLGGIAMSAVKRSLMPLIWTVALIMVNNLLCEEMIKTATTQTMQTTYQNMQALPSPNRHVCNCQTNYANFAQTVDQSQTAQTWEGAQPPTWGAQPSAQLSEYPNNPSRYDQPYAVRSRLPASIRTTPDASLARMFNSPETYAFDSIVAPIPDSTLMARQPVCMTSGYTSSNTSRDAGKLRWIS